MTVKLAIEKIQTNAIEKTGEYATREEAESSAVAWLKARGVNDEDAHAAARLASHTAADTNARDGYGVRIY